jgi:hypothetical protein
MKLSPCVLIGLLVAAPAAAQTNDELQISIAAFTRAAHGADAPARITRSTGIGLKIGEPTVGIFSHAGCDGFSLTVPPNDFKEDATTGWRVEVTPLKIVEHAVTFRLRWVRAVDKGRGSEPNRWPAKPTGEDIEVTLRPGESRTIDTIPVAYAGLKTVHGRPCDTMAASLRVSVDFPDFDRRLIAADVWLVERLPSGKEQSQLQSVRGLPHRPIAFYFDGVPDGARRIDFFGKLVTDPQQETIGVELETVKATPDPGQQGYQASRWFRSTLHVKPDEIVEVALAQPDEKAGSERIFSLRIRARQIR